MCGDIMSVTNNSEPSQIVLLVRRLFRALSQKSNENLTGLGISAADRAVLEFLYPDKMLSVPEIAERYKVSRQHVQSTINVLLTAALVVAKENPKHKRSPLMMLNLKGRKLFESVLKKDEEAIEVLFSRLSKSNIQVTRRTLESILNELS